MATMYKTIGDQNYNLFETSLSGATGIDVTAQVASEFDRISIISDGILTAGYNYIHNPDGTGRYFFAVDENDRRTINGNKHITTLVTDPLRNMSIRTGVAYTRGNDDSSGYFDPILDRGKTITGSLEALVRLDYYSTRANASENPDDMTFNHEHEQNFSGNVKEIYDFMLSKSKLTFQYGSQIMTTISPETNILSTDVLQNIFDMAKQYTGSPEVALNTPISVCIMGNTFNFILRDCFNGTTFKIDEMTNTFGSVVGYKIGQNVYNVPPVIYSPITDTYLEYASDNDYSLNNVLDTGEILKLWAEGVGYDVLRKALPDSVFKLPEDILDSTGLNVALSLFQNADIWKHYIINKKMSGANFSFDASSSLNSFYTLKVPDTGQKDLSVYKSGVESLSTSDKNLNTLLTTSQNGQLVRGQLTGSFAGLSPSDISRAVAAVNNGIRIF